MRQTLTMTVLTIVYFVFQCDFTNVHCGDELLHIFSQHIRKTETELREIMRSYMLKRVAWLQHISHVVLQEVGVSVEDYIDMITTSGVPLDFISMVVLCQIYHFHVAIYMSTGVWATCRSKSIKDCLFGVAYNGNFDFTETVKLGKGEDYNRWLDQQHKIRKMSSHDLMDVLPEFKFESKDMTVQEALTYINNAVCKHNENVSMCKPCLLQRVKLEPPFQAVKELMPFMHEKDATKEYADDTKESLESEFSQRLAQSSHDDVQDVIPADGTDTPDDEMDIICTNSTGLQTVSHDLLLSCPLCDFTEKTQK